MFPTNFSNSEACVVEAATQSFGMRTKTVSNGHGPEELYLYRHLGFALSARLAVAKGR